MTDPFTFSSTTPHHDLPLLFAGQSQKEVTVNEALLVVDMLMQPVVQGISLAPPTAPTAGQCWIVGASPTGAFADHGDTIAAWSESGWRFLKPTQGMRVFDASEACHRLYNSEWILCSPPAAPTGGTVVDTEARAALAALVAALRAAGILSAS